tara:strand:- start:2483 stop:3211 length:729 start_codon:yes stop_codon:yes gene_type:complete
MRNNTLFITLIFILFSFNLFSASIEILSDVPGTGPKVLNHYKVSVHYRGFLEDGTEFDSSFKRNQPFVFQIGTRQVIQGWELGIQNMNVGGKRTIKIPPDLAYGKNGAGDKIPPNATLIFDIEIIGIQKPGYIIITPKKLYSLIEEGSIVVDIRTKEQWKKTGIIKSSKKITAFTKEGNFEPTFLKSLKKISNTTSKIIFVSQKGEISSILANGFVEQLGYKNIYSLKGGIDEWIKKGNKLK